MTDGIEDAVHNVLVLDDSRAQRRLLRLFLEQWGYVVHEADCAEAALVLCEQQSFDMVLSDWVMPGMSGLEFCRKFRALPNDSYGYFILLTSKSEKEEVAHGLEAGADDFLSKPVTPAELRARIRAGERQLMMQHELKEKNRLLKSTLGRLQEIYDSLDRDLIEARKIQQSLVRERHKAFATATISLLLRPSGHVGGDLVGYSPVGPDALSFFSVDVSGHGVASAMMAARLAGLFTGSSIDGNMTLDLEGTAPAVWPPEVVAERLNRFVLDIMQVDHYFTFIFAQANLKSGHVSMVQAGHPHPLHLQSSGQVVRIGSGGLPVGLLPAVSFERIDLTLQPGDRLLLISDGVTECTNAQQEELGKEGLERLVLEYRELHGPDFLDALQWDVENYTGTQELSDDVSAVFFEFHGNEADRRSPR